MLENAPSLKEAFDMVLQEYIRLAPIIKEYDEGFFDRLTYVQLPADERPEVTLDNLYTTPPDEVSMLELHILRSPMTYYKMLLNNRNGLGLEANIERYVSSLAAPQTREVQEDHGILANNTANQLYRHILEEVTKRLELDIQLPPEFFAPKAP